MYQTVEARAEGLQSRGALAIYQNSFARRAITFIFFFTIVHLVLAFALELGNDESYYWMYSQELKSNYFDHPPMVALAVRLFTFNGRLQDPGNLRLAAVFSAALASWFLFRAVSKLHSPRAGFYAVALYNASFYAGVTAGIYIMPDSPQMLFWTAALWMMALVLEQERSWLRWLLLGAAIGASIMSKVHGVFLGAGLAGFVLFHRRHWLKLPQFYAAAALALLIASPIIYWNIRHNFVTYRFHSGRVSIDHFTMSRSGFFHEFISQIFFNNPVNVFLIVVAFRHWRRLPEAVWEKLLLFNWIALPHALALLCISLYRDTTLPHWSGPAYITLLPLAAIALANRPRRERTPLSVLLAPGLYLITLSLWMGLVYFWPGTYGSQREDRLGTGDISLDLHGWKSAGAAFANCYKADIAAGLVPQGTPVIASYWWGAHQQYYFCRPMAIPFMALGPLQDIREYYWRNTQTRPPVAYAILASDEHYHLPEGYAQQRLRYRIIAFRNGRPAHIFSVYLLKQ